MELRHVDRLFDVLDQRVDLVTVVLEKEFRGICNSSRGDGYDLDAELFKKLAFVHDHAHELGGTDGDLRDARIPEVLYDVRRRNELPEAVREHRVVRRAVFDIGELHAVALQDLGCRKKSALDVNKIVAGAA